MSLLNVSITICDRFWTMKIAIYGKILLHSWNVQRMKNDWWFELHFLCTKNCTNKHYPRPKHKIFVLKVKVSKWTYFQHNEIKLVHGEFISLTAYTNLLKLIFVLSQQTPPGQIKRFAGMLIKIARSISIHFQKTCDLGSYIITLVGMMLKCGQCIFFLALSKSLI